MSLKNLGTITRNLNLVDTDRVFTLGGAMYMAGFEKTACRVQTDRDRSIWMKGFDSAREKWLTMTQRWHEMDKGAR